MSEEKTRGIGLGPLGTDLSAPSGKNHLLVIAIDEYEQCPVLNNCVNDANGLIEVLKERYDFEDENIQTLFNKEATRPNIHARLKGLKERVTPDDNVIIYFSGHGETEDNVGYWVPVEADPNNEWEFVSTNALKSRLDVINSFHTFVIVDACFSGALFSSYRSVKAGNENKRSRLGLAASHTRERALDGTAGENSPFSTHLIKMLRENTGILSAQKLAGEIIDEVYGATKGKQTPVFKPLDVKGDDAGQFVFRLKADEGADWKTCQDLGTLAVYEAFIAKYPEGKYADEAQEQILVLRDEEAWKTAQSEHTVGAYFQYRKENADGQYRDEALEAIQELEEDQSWRQAQRKRTIFDYEHYLEKYPSGKYAEEAQEALQALLGGHAPPKAKPAPKTPSKPQPKEEKLSSKPKQKTTQPQKKSPAAVKTDKPSASAPASASNIRREQPSKPKTTPAGPIDRKYLMIGGGILVVAVIVISLVFFGGGKSTDPATAENLEDAAGLDQTEGLTLENADQPQISNSITQDKAVVEPEKKTSTTPTATIKVAPATIGSNGVTFDGKTYRIFRSGGLSWMARNLDYQVTGSWCYSGSNTNCQKYGRLYNWKAAKAACAAMGSGWRLPTEREWKSLARQFGGADEDSSDGGAAAFKGLTAKGVSSFGAQLGGWRDEKGSYKHLGSSGYYWSSAENALGLIQLYYFTDGQMGSLNNDPRLGYSCRCVK